MLLLLLDSAGDTEALGLWCLMVRCWAVCAAGTSAAAPFAPWLLLQLHAAVATQRPMLLPRLQKALARIVSLHAVAALPAAVLLRFVVLLPDCATCDTYSLVWFEMPLRENLRALEALPAMGASIREMPGAAPLVVFPLIIRRRFRVLLWAWHICARIDIRHATPQPHTAVVERQLCSEGDSSSTGSTHIGCTIASPDSRFPVSSSC